MIFYKKIALRASLEHGGSRAVSKSSKLILHKLFKFGHLFLMQLTRFFPTPHAKKILHCKI